MDNSRASSLDASRNSSTITSFYLVPEDGAVLPSFSPGQYLSIKLNPSNDPNEQIRQYSLSCAPNADFYRISVGRERSESGNTVTPDGVVSNYLHDHINIGDTLLVHAPLGDFVLDETSIRPVTLISGGTGITPMLSMFERLTESGRRQVTFVHGARSRAHHAFGKKIREITRRCSHAKAVIFYNEVEEDDVRGEHHDESGFIDATMLDHSECEVPILFNLTSTPPAASTCRSFPRLQRPCGLICN